MYIKDQLPSSISIAEEIMSLYETIDPISDSILISIILKNIIESIVCISTIIINIILITSVAFIKRLHTTQNLLLINVCFACILFSLSCIGSISLTIYIVHTKIINPYICQFIGVLIILSSHGVMFSYTLVTFVRFLTIIYPFNKKINSIRYIKIYLISMWTLPFLLSGISLIIPSQRITFQTKAKLCIHKQRSPLLFIYFCTSYIIPFLSISLMNLTTYLNVVKSRQMHLLSRSKLSRFNRRKRRNLRLLRQFSFFSIIFLLGWTPFIIVEVFDKQEKLPDILYLFTLILPSICLLIDSHAILYWNKTIHNEIQLWRPFSRRNNKIINHERNNDKVKQDSESISTNKNNSTL